MARLYGRQDETGKHSEGMLVVSPEALQARFIAGIYYRGKVEERGVWDIGGGALHYKRGISYHERVLRMLWIASVSTSATRDLLIYRTAPRCCAKAACLSESSPEITKTGSQG